MLKYVYKWVPGELLAIIVAMFVRTSCNAAIVHKSSVEIALRRSRLSTEEKYFLKAVPYARSFVAVLRNLWLVLIKLTVIASVQLPKLAWLVVATITG